MMQLEKNTYQFIITISMNKPLNSIRNSAKPNTFGDNVRALLIYRRLIYGANMLMLVYSIRFGKNSEDVFNATPPVPHVRIGAFFYEMEIYEKTNGVPLIGEFKKATAPGA